MGRRKKKNNKSVIITSIIIVCLIIAGFFLYGCEKETEPLSVITPPTSFSGGGGGGGKIPTPTPSVTYEFCYQESPTVENQTGIDGNCGLNYMGSFSSGNESEWNNFSLLNDGDWDTGSYGLDTVLPYAEVSILYYKPYGALPNSLFLHKHDNYYGNVTIPSACWNYDENYLVFTAVSRTFTNETITFNYTAFHCFNGDTYPTLTSLTMEGVVYEDAMLWAFPEGYMAEYEIQ